jgi:PAS domain S-box-containing protein
MQQRSAAYEKRRKISTDQFSESKIKENKELEQQVQTIFSDLSKIQDTLKSHIKGRNQALLELKLSERRYRQLFEHANDSIFIVDPSTRLFLDVNKNATKRLGYSREELLRMSIDSITCPKLAYRNSSRIRNLQKTGSMVFEHCHKRRDGTHLPVEISSRVIEYGGRKVFQSFVRDITERKKAEESLKKAHSELESKVESRTKELSKTNLSLKKEITQRRKADEALKASEEKYSTLVEKGNDGIIIIQDGILKFVNQKIVKITGYSREGALNKPFINFVSPKYRKVVLRRYKKRLRGERVPNKYEIEILSKSGKKIPVEVNASLINHENKLADMAIIRDITERKEVEVLLAEEKKKMEMIYKTTKEGVTLYDKDCRVVYTNTALKKLLGLRQNIVGFKRIEIAKNRAKFYKYGIERADTFLDTERKVLSGETISNVLIRVLSKPTKYIEGDYVPIKSRKGKVVGLVGTFRDVTLQKNQSVKITHNLLEVRRQKDRLEAIFENIEEGSFIMDKERRVIQANNACALMSGSTEKEMVGKRYFQIFGCHDRNNLGYPEFDPVSKVLATKESIPYDEHLHNDSNGNKRWVGVSYTPIFDKSGEVEQMVGVIRDITAIKELEKAKSQFVSVASHELRTPLTVINGYLSLLLSGDLGHLEDKEARAAYVGAIEKVYGETNRLTKLVGELLNVSRIEEGRLKLTLRKVHLSDIVEEVIGEFKSIANEKNLNLKLSNRLVGNQSRYVLGDRDKLKQVLVNLLDNAVKFTNSGGTITTKCFPKNGEAFVQVLDTGTGIAPNMLPLVFEKFQQSSEPYLKENQGTGLGLFIVKSLIEMHKGNISVESKLGEGTKFIFNLPLVADR